ncbi:hypothetical protein ILUMI_05525 [Ignelater luminosus]|uniref:RING-type domain-containing protein n=1 Tax=Ignelater luminosus TaxID=2038154 RepID=A0A8K0DBS0_IGNLU|nr:hypothetical protein ILUMI_05525 [Ignelater luminosus]
MANNHMNTTSPGNAYSNIYIHNDNTIVTHSPTSMPPPYDSVGSDGELRLIRSGAPRRTAESTRLLNDVLREFQQHVESARMANSRGISISNLLNRPSTSESSPNSSQNQLNDSIVINLENVVPHSSASNANISHSNFQAASLLNGEGMNTNGNSNSNNNADDGPSTDTLRNVIEAQQSLEILQKYLPFLLILIAKGLYDHCEGIFNLIILFATFMHANSVVKREATKQARRSLSKLFVALLYIFACFAFIAYVFEDEKLYLNLVFIPPYKQPATVWALLWTAGLTDFILKLITIIFKVLLTMLPVKVIPFQRRGKVYLFIEAVSQLYRSLATIQPWLYYLLESYQGAEKIVGVFLSAAYMVSKGTDLMCRLRLFKTAILKLLQNVALGSLPSKDQIQTAGNHCPICHDEYDSPVLLQCRHIFCESCVSTWFDREQTCPLCRAKIVDDPSWRDGSTTYFMQLF